MLSASSPMQEERLSELKQNMVSGMFAEQDRKRRMEQVAMLIQNALFLKDDQNRKRAWLKILGEIDAATLARLSEAIIRENLRFKKGERDICVELNTSFPVAQTS